MTVGENVLVAIFVFLGGISLVGIILMFIAGFARCRSVVTESVRTDVAAQKQIEKELFVHLFKELEKMDQVNHLYGDKLMKAIYALYQKYGVSTSDAETILGVKFSKNFVLGMAPSVIKKAMKKYHITDIEPFPIYRQIWLDYSPHHGDIPPLVNNPDLLILEKTVARRVLGLFVRYPKKHYNSAGVEIKHPRIREKKFLYRYKYNGGSWRLVLNGLTTPLPLYWINKLVVELAKRRLQCDHCTYAPDLSDSSYSIAKNEDEEREREKEEKIEELNRTYPWLEEDKEKYKK